MIRLPDRLTQGVERLFEVLGPVPDVEERMEEAKDVNVTPLNNAHQAACVAGQPSVLTVSGR